MTRPEKSVYHQDLGCARAFRISKVVFLAALFILMAQFGAAIAEQPSCDDLSIRNPDAVILCQGRRWFAGNILPDQPTSTVSFSQQNPAKPAPQPKAVSSFSPDSVEEALPSQKRESSGVGVLASVILLLVIIFIAPMFQRNQKNQKLIPKPHRDQAKVKVQVSTSGFSIPERESSVSPDSVWVPQGKSSQVAGYTIPGGFIYVGSGLLNVQGWSVEPAQIDPSLPVDKSSSDRLGVHMSYWPSYSEIDPSSRNAYLQWLAEGCCDPGINIGYVFLYFYGLERRVLADPKNSYSAGSESEEIVAEVKRLGTIYRNPSFLSYTTGFINTVEARSAKEKLYKNTPSYESRGYELPFGLKKGLAQLAVDGSALPVDWALAWLESDQECGLRTPAQRCKPEFQKLFRIRYVEKFGQGIILPQKGSKLRGNYRPASPSFGQALEWTEEGLLDVSVYRGPIKQIFKVAEDCVEELDPYSRHLGRSGSDPSSLAKLALFPEPLLKDYQDAELQGLSQWLSKSVHTDRFLKTDLKSIVGHFALLKSENFDKREFVALCQLLAKLRVGIEPDVRFGGTLPEECPVILFPLPKDSAHAPSPEYSSATVILHLAVAVAGADGRISEKEEKNLEEQLEVRFKLNGEEKVRLRAHTQWLFASSPSFSGVKKRLESFSQSQREILGEFLVSVAQQDGLIDPGEVKILNKIYGLLGLDSKALYSNAHRAAMEPVKIEDAESQTPAFSLPKAPPKKKSIKVDLDMNKIRVKLAETAAVTAMLNTIFVEEKNERMPVKEAPQEIVGNLKHFEFEYHGLIKELLQKTAWSRVELEALAAKSNLLLDGVLDSINDVSFTVFDQPFFEGEDPVEINPGILKELQL